MVQFHLIAAMAGRERKLRRRERARTLSPFWRESAQKPVSATARFLTRVTTERCGRERLIFQVCAPIIGNCEDCSG